MPKKKKQESQKKQSERFLRKVRELEDAGELIPTEAEERFERAVARITDPSQRASSGQKS